MKILYTSKSRLVLEDSRSQCLVTPWNIGSMPIMNISHDQRMRVVFTGLNMPVFLILILACLWVSPMVFMRFIWINSNTETNDQSDDWSIACNQWTCIRSFCIYIPHQKHNVFLQNSAAVNKKIRLWNIDGF